MTTVHPNRDSSDRRIPLLIGGIILMVTALLTLTGLPFGGDGEHVSLGATAPVIALRWPVDGRATYEVEVVSNVMLNQGQADRAAQQVPQELRGALCLRVFAASEGHAEVGMQMQRVSYRFGDTDDPQRAEALTAPFSCTFQGGVPTAFRFPDGLDVEVCTQLEELVRSFQVTLPSEPGQEWTAVEQCAAGRFRAVYQRSADGSIQKRKASYLGGAPLRAGNAELGTAETRVLRSSGSLHWVSNGVWLDHAVSEEELEIAAEGATVARVTQRARLKKLNTTIDAAALSAMRIEDLLERGDAAVRASQSAVEGEDPAPEPRAATAEDIALFRAEVAAFVAAGGDDVLRLHALARFLAECPELARLVPEILARGDLPDPAASGLTHALELADTADSQDALIAVFEDGNRDFSARRRAIAALGGVRNPTPETVQSLWRLTEHNGDTDLASSALLALGAVGQSMKSTAPDRYADLLDGLRAHLDGAAQPESALVALKAIGNTADAALLPAVTERLTAASPMVRAAAAQAMGTMDGPQALVDLTTRLQAEPDGRVRAAIARSVARSPNTSAETSSLFHRLVETEQDDGARGAMARYLVDRLDEYPDARGTLERLVKTETDRSTLAYVAGRLYRRQ